MKLRPTKFFAAFHDGLLEMSGHAFEARDLTFVVHKRREPYVEWDQTYLVSEMETGFLAVDTRFRNRLAAAQFALEQINAIPQAKLDEALRRAAMTRRSLPKIEGGKR